MVSFVMVVNEVTTEQLAKMLEIQARSHEKLRWVSQGHPALPQQYQQNQFGVYSPGMQQANKQVPNTSPVRNEVVYNYVRLEWNEEAAHFAREIFDLFIREERKEMEQAG